MHKTKKNVDGYKLFIIAWKIWIWFIFLKNYIINFDFRRSFEITSKIKSINMNNITKKMSSSKIKSKKFTLEDFVMISLIGQGTYAKVFLVKHKATEQVYALKVLKKRKLLNSKNIKHILRERNILISLKSHPFLISFYAAF